MPLVMSLFGGAMKLVSAAFAFLKKLEPFQLLSLALAIAVGIQTARIEGFGVWPISIRGLEVQLDDAKGKLADEQRARRDDRAAYRAAQLEAELRNRATVKKIETRHEEISDRVRSDYQRDLQRLREQSKANRGAPGGPGVSQVPQATGGADADGVQSPSCDLLCAQEIELRLMHLQIWVREQAGVAATNR